MLTRTEDICLHQALHSILDIFQLEMPGKFTVLSYFTFHSGYIPIKSDGGKKSTIIGLYIPFWIYSNGYRKMYVKKTYNFFTFHSGYIPMLIMQIMDSK